MAHNKKRILVVGENKRIVYQNFLSILSKECIVKEWYALSNPDKAGFFLTRWLSIINNWDKMIRKFKPDKIIICGGALISIWIIVFLIRVYRLRIEIIVFRYDIEYFRPYSRGFLEKIGHFIARKLEKFCLIRADKIIHKGLENELQYLPFYEKIKDKPHYLFREFLDADLIQKYDPKIKLSAKDNEVHLVYTGGLYLKDLPVAESFWKFYPKITKQKLHLHIYSKVSKEIISKFKRIERKDNYFHYEGYRKHNDLIKDLTKYEYGIHLFGGGKIKGHLITKTSFSNKNFDYISANLPIICSKNLEAVSEFVEKNKIGFPIEYNEMHLLKKILKNRNKNYNRYILNIRRFRDILKDYKEFNNFLEE